MKLVAEAPSAQLRVTFLRIIAAEHGAYDGEHSTHCALLGMDGVRAIVEVHRVRGCERDKTIV